MGDGSAASTDGRRLVGTARWIPVWPRGGMQVPPAFHADPPSSHFIISTTYRLLSPGHLPFPDEKHLPPSVYLNAAVERALLV